MSDQLLESVRDAFEGQIDFEGQRLADLLTTAILAIAGIVAFGVGALAQDIHLSLYTGLAGTALAFLVVVPPWPFFKQHPVRWLPVQRVVGGTPIEVDGQKIS
ncbi:MAG: hypothetical protein M1823_003456 [Watsoniomyces obsoletus]|nr:MAG: hypothetical protein M1823_003456 [Watsoniomyces obsoletus]